MWHRTSRFPVFCYRPAKPHVTGSQLRDVSAENGHYGSVGLPVRLRARELYVLAALLVEEWSVKGDRARS